MHFKRVITALIGLPLFALLIFRATDFLFFLAVLVVALMGQKEFYDLAEGESLRVQKFLGLLMGALLLRGFYYGDFSLILRMLALGFFLILVSRTFSQREVTNAVKEIGISFLGLFYVCFLLGYVILIRGQVQGEAWVFFLFLVVWAGDSGAYYVGRRFGRRKLLAKISPKKTVEGAVGGLVCSLAAASIGWLAFFPERDLLQVVVLGGALGVIGQIGDLCESLLKRSAGCKDSGSLFPGHGGVLDRFDGILLSSPVLYYAVWLGSV